MHIDWGAGRFPDTVQTDDVVDVRVRDDDGSHFQMMAVDGFQNSRGVVAGIDHDCFAGLRIADDVAIALQQSYWEDFVDEVLWPAHAVNISFVGSASA